MHAGARERRGNEDPFYKLADALPQLAWLARPDGIFWYNRRWYDYTGMTPAEASGWGWQRVHHPEHVQRVTDRFRLSLEGGEPWDDTFPLRAKDGQYRWFVMHVTPIREENGQIAYWFGTNTDVTDTKRAEHAARESEARLNALVEASPLGIAVMDLNGNPVFYNPKCAELHGLSIGAASGDGWGEAVHPEDRERIMASWYEAARAGRSWSETYRFLHPDGRVVWISGRAAPMRIDGRPAGYIGTLEDISQLKAAEAEAERLLGLEHEARLRAEKAIGQRDEVAAIVAHDLRNPLQTLTMAAAIMRRARLSDGERERQLEIVERCARTMNRLIGDLLDAARVDAGTLVVDKLSVNLHALLRETIDLFEASAHERGISLDCDMQPGSGEAVGDYDRLAQVLSNLVGNALRFTHRGGTIRLHAVREEGQFLISVEDNGSGIPAEKVPHLFDRYWQADRNSRSGTGLGLGIARAIVEAHGGRIWAESEPGVGTTIRFTVPEGNR